MNLDQAAPAPAVPLPRCITMAWWAAGFYVVSINGSGRCFVDPEEACAEVNAAVDPRLCAVPEGSC